MVVSPFVYSSENSDASSVRVFASRSLCCLPASVVTHLPGQRRVVAVCWERCCNFVALLAFYLYVIVVVYKQTINRLLLEPGLWMLPEQTASGSVRRSTPVSSNKVCFLWSPSLLSVSLPRKETGVCWLRSLRAPRARHAAGTLRPLSVRWVDWLIKQGCAWEQRKGGRVRDTETQLKSPDQWTRCLRRMMLICWSGWRRKGHPLSLR